jgi:hypothetical protein
MTCTVQVYYLSLILIQNYRSLQTSCAELGGIFPNNGLKAISFETMLCNPNKEIMNIL